MQRVINNFEIAAIIIKRAVRSTLMSNLSREADDLAQCPSKSCNNSLYGA